MTHVSIVAPCFNEAQSLYEFHRRVRVSCLQAVGERAFEIVLVDDGSADDTWRVIEDLCDRDPSVVGLRLSRNFGHQAALTAGLQAATGEIVMMIDADLQDPPELLTQMMATMRDENADVVYGRRVKRLGETAFKRWSASLFYRLIDRFSEVRIPRDTGDFRLVSRAVLDALLGMPERYRFVRGMVSWLGFKQVAIEYVRDARYAGATNYTLARMIKFSIDALTSFSTAPLQFAHAVANMSLIIGLLTVAYVAYSFFAQTTVPGWTSILAFSALFASAQMFILGVMGEYLGRMYMESKRRPLFIIAKSVRKAHGPEAQLSARAEGAALASSHAP